MYYTEVVLVWIGAMAGLGFLAIYGLLSRWWRNPVGCFLMAQGVFITGIFVRSIVVSFLLPGPVPVTLSSFVTACVFAVLEVTQFAVFACIIRKRGKGNR